MVDQPRSPLITKIEPRDTRVAVNSQAWVGSYPSFPLKQIGVEVLVKKDWTDLPPRGPEYPVALRTWAPPSHMIMLGQDRIYGDPGQTHPFDWPNPRGREYPVALRTWAPPSHMIMRGQDSIYGGPGQVPDYDWPNPRGKEFPVELRTFAPPSRLVLTMAKPFNQDDWTNPVIEPFPIDLRTFAPPTRTVFLHKPFNQDDWPNPFGLERPLQDWLQRAILGTQDPFLPVDWQNPRGPGFPGQDWLQAPSLALTTGNPFLPPDLPNPRGPDFPVELRTWLAPDRLILIGQDSIYGGPGQVPTYDWTNPSLGPQLPVRDWVLGTSLGLRLTGNPFFPPDLPNPRGPGFPIDLRTWIAPDRLILIGQDSVYGGPGQVPTYDWQNPVRARERPPTTWTWAPPSNLVLTMATPFRQGDWPNPRGKVWPPWTWAPPSGLVLTLATPFRQEDWPNPRGPEFATALRTWTGRTPISVSIPFSMLDWPNPPRGPARGITLLTWLNAAQVQLIGQDKLPFRQREWPVPKGYMQSVEYRTLANMAPGLLQTLNIKPPGQSDWPVPMGRMAAPNMYTFAPSSTLPAFVPPTPVRNIIGFPAVPLWQVNTLDLWINRIGDVLRGVLQGRLNVTKEVTLNPNVGATNIIDQRISAQSAIILVPLTANAVAIQSSVYVSSQTTGAAVLTHNASANTDNTFTVVIIG